eukprot:gene25970-31362_t
MSELEQIKGEIKEAKAKLEEAERVGRSEAYLISLQNNLVELRKKENLLMTQSVPTPVSESPRCAGSVYVLCTEDMIPVGTAFIVSSTLALSAYHCVAMDPNKPTRSHTKNWVIVQKLERASNGSVFPFGEVIPVIVHRFAMKEDFVLLRRSDHRIFEADRILRICPRELLPDWTNEVNLKVYHCPVALFNQGTGMDAIHAVPLKVKRTIVTGHRCWTDQGLFGGSSGAPYVVCDHGPLFGKVYAIHVQSISTAKGLSDCKSEGKDPDEMMSEVTDSLVECHGSCGEANILSAFTQLMKNII